MKIKEQAGLINDALQTWINTLTPAGQGNGYCRVVSDMSHLWYLLFNGPKTLKCLTMYVGENIRDVFPGAAILGRVDRGFKTVVSRSRGFAADRSDPLKDDTVYGVPLFDLVEQARDVIRGLQFNPVSTERPIDYVGVDQFSTGDTKLIIDAYGIDYTIGSQLDSPITQT